MRCDFNRTHFCFWFSYFFLAFPILAIIFFCTIINSIYLYMYVSMLRHRHWIWLGCLWLVIENGEWKIFDLLHEFRPFSTPFFIHSIRFTQTKKYYSAKSDIQLHNIFEYEIGLFFSLYLYLYLCLWMCIVYLFIFSQCWANERNIKRKTFGLTLWNFSTIAPSPMSSIDSISKTAKQ